MPTKVRKSRKQSGQHYADDPLHRELTADGPRWDWWEAIESDGGLRAPVERSADIPVDLGFYVDVQNNPCWTTTELSGDLGEKTYFRAIILANVMKKNRPSILVKRRMTATRWNETLRTCELVIEAIQNHAVACPLCGYTMPYSATHEPVKAAAEVLYHLENDRCAKLQVARISVNTTYRRDDDV